MSAPAPGTILTLTVAMEDAAAFEGDDVVELLKRMVAETDRAVARTREENPTNRAAGVVDAGARGLQLLLEGVLSGLTGKEVPLTKVPLATPSLHVATSQAPSWEGAYDVQFLVQQPTRPVAKVREEMLRFGATRSAARSRAMNGWIPVVRWKKVSAPRGSTSSTTASRAEWKSGNM